MIELDRLVQFKCPFNNDVFDVSMLSVICDFENKWKQKATNFSLRLLYTHD